MRTACVRGLSRAWLGMRSLGLYVTDDDENGYIAWVDPLDKGCNQRLDLHRLRHHTRIGPWINHHITVHVERAVVCHDCYPMPEDCACGSIVWRHRWSNARYEAERCA